MGTTKLSNKGTIVIANSIRDAHRWRAGTEFIVIDTRDGLLLKAVRPFKATKLEDVIGCANFDGPPLSVEEMNEAVSAEARRRAKR